VSIIREMSDQVKQLLGVPREFIKDGAFFLNRCTKPSRKGTLLPTHLLNPIPFQPALFLLVLFFTGG
jgi:hypothetical protein